jgi:uncharacterized protein (TIGR00297 family)
MTNNLIGLILTFFYIALTIATSTILQKLKLFSDESSRKFIHIAVSNCWIFVMIFFDNIWLACIPPIAFIILNYISYKYDLIKSMEGGKKKSFGTVYYPISLLILVLITFWLDMTYLGAVGILILGYGDGLAGLIGNKYGKKKLFYDKTIVGTTTMFIASLIVSFVVLTIFTPSIAIAGSLVLAIIATMIELFTPRDLDNLSVPLGSAAVYFGLITIGSVMVNILLIAIILNGVVAIVAFKRKSLDLSGVIAALVVGVSIYMFAGPITWVILMLFFTTSSIITHIKQTHKARLSPEYEKSKRNYKQVIASGLVPTVFSILYYFTKSDIMLLTAVSAIAISCSDTWASELGILNKGKTVLITTLKSVKKGESGGISLLGTIMSVAGSFMIAISFTLCQFIFFNLPLSSILYYVSSIAVIGVIGCFIDSIFGATIQAKYIGSKTKLVTESKKSNGKQNQRISGLSFMNNDMVNLTSSIIGGIGAFIFFTVF